jgi:SMI1 / KNR4 family (SUKH-1)
MHEWEPWLQKWNRELLARYDPAEYNAFVDPQVTPTVLTSGWLGFPGVSDGELAELEARLGMTLPPSYRSFLRVSNGFLQPGVIVPRLLPADEVAWLREVDPDTIDAWTEVASRTGGLADPDSFEQYLPTALQVSARETVGTAMYLLNPRVANADGEWEAFFFAHWVPGVRRFPSFRALMQAELEDLLAPAPPPPPSRLQTFVDAVRWIFR